MDTTQHSRSAGLLQVAVMACGGAAMAIAVMPLLGHLCGWRLTGALASPRVSAAPYNAVALGALGAAVLVLGLRPGERWGAAFSAIAGGGVGCLGLATAVAALAGVGSRWGGISPATACNLLLGGVGTLTAASPRCRTVSAAVAMALAVSGSVMVLGYVYGTPLLYGTPIRPASLPASVSSACIGLGLLLAAGPEAWPLRLLAGPSVQALLLRTFLPFTLGAIIFSDLAILLFVRHAPANPALVSAVTASVCLLVAGLLVSRAGAAVGGDIDRTAAELRRSERELAALSQRLVEVQEMERRTLSRELHDRVGQTLTALGINLTMVRHESPTPLSESAAARVDESIELLDQIGAQVEDLMNELRPPMLDEYGLPSALQWGVEQFTRRTGIRAEVRAAQTPGRRLSADAETSLFRVVQEALNNVAKHARAANVIVFVEDREGQIAVGVEDDGVGISPGAPAVRGGRCGYGLATMRERVRALGGTLDVRSRPGGGTVVVALVPCTASPDGRTAAGAPPADQAVVPGAEASSNAHQSLPR